MRQDKHYSLAIDFEHYINLDDNYEALIEDLSSLIIDWRDKGYREITLFYSPLIQYNSFNTKEYEAITQFNVLREGKYPYTKFDIHFLANSLNEYKFASVSIVSQFIGDDYLTNINPTIIKDLCSTSSKSDTSLYTALLNFINHALTNSNKFMESTENLLEDEAIIADIIINPYNINPFANEDRYMEQYILEVKSLLERAKNI